MSRNFAHNDYLRMATEVYDLMKGQNSGVKGKQKQIDAIKLMIQTLERIIDDLPNINSQIVQTPYKYPIDRAYLKFFLDQERKIIKQNGASDEYANELVNAASKYVNISTIKRLTPQELEDILRERLQIAREILSFLENSDTALNSKNRKKLLKLCYLIGAIGAIGANHYVLPAFVPYFSPGGVALSQSIADTLIGNLMFG